MLRPYMLRAKADADHPRGHAAQYWRQQPEDRARGPGNRESPLRIGPRPEHLAMNKDLDVLSHARRPFPPLLHPAQIIDPAISLPELLPEQICRRHRVLYRQIDADAAGGRQGVRGGADEEQPGTIPLSKPVHLHCEKSDLLPVINVAHGVPQKGRDADDFFAERLQPPTLDLFKRAFANDGAALVIIAAIDRDQYLPVSDPSQRRFGVSGGLRDSKPEHINRNAEILDFHSGPLAHD